MNIKGKHVCETTACPSSQSMLYSSMEGVPVTVGVGTMASQLMSDTTVYAIPDIRKRLNGGDDENVCNQVYRDNQCMSFGDPVVRQLPATEISAAASILLPDVTTVSDKEGCLIGSEVYADDWLLSANNTLAPVSPNMLPSQVQVTSYLDKGKAILDPQSTATVYVSTVDGSYSTFGDHVYLEGCPNAIAGTSITDVPQVGAVSLLDLHAGVVVRATLDNEVRQFSSTDLSRQSAHSAAILSATSSTCDSTSADPGQQPSQTTHPYVTGPHVLDFATGVIAPLTVDIEPERFVLRGVSQEPRRGRRPNLRSHRARPPGILAPLRGLAHALPDSVRPVTTGTRYDSCLREFFSLDVLCFYEIVLTMRVS